MPGGATTPEPRVLCAGALSGDNLGGGGSGGGGIASPGGFDSSIFFFIFGGGGGGVDGFTAFNGGGGGCTFTFSLLLPWDAGTEEFSDFGGVDIFFFGGCLRAGGLLDDGIIFFGGGGGRALEGFFCFFLVRDVFDCVSISVFVNPSSVICVT